MATNHIGVETTQHVKLNYNPAPIGDRLIAFFLDGFTLIGFYLITVAALGVIANISEAFNSFSEQNEWIFFVIYVIPSFFYHLIFEVVWNGKSFGKWLMGLRVVRVDGTNPTLGNYVIRWMFRLLEITLTSGMVAFITVLVNGKGQRLGDIAAKTCVIKTTKKVKLSDTIYAELEKEYKVRYPEVIDLSDADIRTIKEVLAAEKGYDRTTWFVMIQRTANIIQNKVGIQKLEVNADDFLERVIEDYNQLHQS